MDGMLQIGRLAMRKEGDNWNAYFAAPGNMHTPIFLGSIRIGAVLNNPERKAAFAAMMGISFPISSKLEQESGPLGATLRRARSMKSRDRHKGEFLTETGDEL